MGVQSNTSHSPSWKWRLLISVVLIAVLTIASKAYDAVQGAVQGELAVGQLSDDPTERAIGRAAAQADPSGVAWTVGGLALFAIWAPYAYALARAASQRTDQA